MNIFDACSLDSLGLLEYIRKLNIRELESDLVRLLDEEGRSEFPRKRFIGATLAKSSNIPVLQHIFSQNFNESLLPELQLFYKICINQAIYDGQLNTLKFLVNDLQSDSESSSVSQLSQLDFSYLDRVKNVEWLTTNYMYFCKVCALRGNDFCLIYLLNKFQYRSEIDINAGEIIYNASQSKRSFKIIRYLFEKSRFKNQINFKNWNYEYLRHLVEIGNVELLEYILFQSPFYNQFDNELCKTLAKLRFKIAPLNIYRSRGILYKASKRTY